ncbi:MAG: AI-2E family transporter [Thermomicrobiaceae bacterium]|nr:AI-2E family transporter [Thermomicrobiaceae bacterium]
MIRIEVSTRGIVTIAAILVALWLTARLWPVLLLVVVSLLFAAALLPFVEWMVDRGLRRGQAVLVLVVLLIAVVALFGFVIVPGVIDQVRALIDEYPRIRDDVVGILERRHAFALARDVREFDPTAIVHPDMLASTGLRAFEILTEVFTVVALTAYILLDAPRIERLVYAVTPDRYQLHLRRLLGDLRLTVGGYIRGQLVTSAAITLFTFTLLTALGVPNALTWGLLAGIADVIPLVGAVLAVVPETLAALQVSVPTAIAVAVLLTLYQEFENRVLVPRVYGSTLRLPTLVVMVALLVGAALAGIMGALLALPFAAALRVILEYGNAIRTGRVPLVAPVEEPFAPDEEAVPR